MSAREGTGDSNERRSPGSLTEELAELEAQLRDVGLDTAQIQLSETTKLPAYRRAVPILLQHLTRDYSDAALCLIACGLAGKVPETRAAWPSFAEAFRRAKEGRGLRRPGDVVHYPFQAKLLLANLLEKTYTPKYLDEVIALAKDTSQGSVRGILFFILKRSKDPRALQAIEDLADDPAFAYEIAQYRKANAKRQEKEGKIG